MNALMTGTLDRYLLRQVLWPMTVTVIVALLALLAERSLSVVDLVLGWRGSFLVIFEMLSYLIPHYMGFALPAAFFLGIMLAFGRLSRESEVDAMRAAGYGLVRMVRPLCWAALGVAVLHLVLVSHLQPYSRYAYRAALHTVTNVSFQTLLRPGRFITLADSTYRVETLAPDGQSFTGLFLYSEESARGSVVVTAERGRIEAPQNDAPLLLHLENGVQQLLRADGAAGVPAVTLRFGELTTGLSGMEPEPFRPRGENERELTLPELWQMQGVDHGDIDAVEIDAELHARLVRTVSILVLPFLACPLALRRRRARRSYGFLIGVAVLVATNQIIKTGESLVDDGDISYLLGLYLPFALFAAGSLWLFLHAATRVPNPGGRTHLDRLTDRLIELGSRLLPARSAS